MKVKSIKTIIIWAFVILSSNVKAQEKWNCQFVVGNYDFGPLNVIFYLDRDGCMFNLYTTKDADIRTLGYCKSKLARLFKKSPKHGIFIQMKDGHIVTQSNGSDSLYGIFLIPMLGKNHFKGIRKVNEISGKLYDDSNKVFATLSGIKVGQEFKFDYRGMPQYLLDTTEKYIFNKNYLENRQWKHFKCEMKKLSEKAVDDLDWFFGFNMKSQKLPFSHYQLLFMPAKPPSDKLDSITTHFVSWKELDTETAFVEVNDFGGTVEEMDSIFREVLEHHYKNLIIDLRKNPGGGLTPAIAFGKHLTDREINVGYFVTNKWYSKMGNRNRNFDLLPVKCETTTEGLQEELKRTEGCRLVVKGGSEVFKGKIYVLTSRSTASTCEPLVYSLKKEAIATIVGENTAGAMLAATLIPVKDNFCLFMAIADYYSPDKQRLDKVGVEPDIKIDADKALDKVLEMIKQ